MSRTDWELEKLVLARDTAAQRLHWHLSKAAAAVLAGVQLGPPFEEEMLKAERARSEWYAAHDAILRWDFGKGAAGVAGVLAKDPCLADLTPRGVSWP